MKNKLVLSGIFIFALLISGCKKGSEPSSSTTSSSDSSYTSSSSSKIAPDSTFDFKFNLDSNIKVNYENGCATTAIDEGEETHITLDCYLSDASVNHKSGNVYTPSNDGTYIAKETSLTDENFNAEMLRMESLPKDIYTAATFFLTFRIIQSPGSKDIGLYLDVPNTLFNLYERSRNGKGYRVGLISDSLFRPSGGVSKVYAPLETANNCRYVSSMSDMSGSTYGENELIDCDYDKAWPYAWSSRSDYTDRPDYLGYFKGLNEDAPGSVAVTLSYCVIVWVEGTDPNIINRYENAFDSFYSTLAFRSFELPSR